jgi:hypothetical protein
VGSQEAHRPVPFVRNALHYSPSIGSVGQNIRQE